MNLQDYLVPFDKESIDISDFDAESLFYSIESTIDIDRCKIAILGVPVDENSNNKGSAFAPDKVRYFLYKLTKINNEKASIVDLGNIKECSSVSDSYYAVADVVEYLMKKNIIPLIIGGTQDITYATYLAYERLEQTINITSIDSTFDISKQNEEVTSKNYLLKILLKEDNKLFNFTNIGYQSYFTSEEDIDLMKELLFDYVRLGLVRDNINKIEPFIRDTDLFTFDMSSIKQSDSPAVKFTSPNGITSDEACQLSRYAGLSDKLSSFGLYELNPEYDNNGQSSHLAAQILWFFMQGVFQRKNDYPFKDISSYKKYLVGVKNIEHDMIFYNNPVTDRWWMEVPYKKNKYEKKIIIPCLYDDYILACNQEIPDKWWKNYQRIS